MDAHGHEESPVEGTRLAVSRSSAPALRVDGQSKAPSGRRVETHGLQCQAWQWALATQASDGAMPSGKAIAAAYGRHERWGRLVKSAGQAGDFGPSAPALKSSEHGEWSE